jgi:hypothetical protein
MIKSVGRFMSLASARLLRGSAFWKLLASNMLHNMEGKVRILTWLYFEDVADNESTFEFWQ